MDKKITNRLSGVFKGYYHELMAVFERTATHKLPGAKGAMRENAVAEFIRNWVSSQYSVHTNAFLVSKEGRELANEIDLIVHDGSIGFVWDLDSQAGNCVATWEETRVIVEVKSVLSKESFESACESAREVSNKFVKHEIDLPKRVLFAYKVDEKFRDEVKELFVYSNCNEFPFDAFIFLDEGAYFSDNLREARVCIEKGLSKGQVRNDASSQDKFVMEDCIQTRMPNGYKCVGNLSPESTLLAFAALISMNTAGDRITQKFLVACMRPEYVPIVEQ